MLFGHCQCPNYIGGAEEARLEIDGPLKKKKNDGPNRFIK
jgi:hypothetical protein